MDSQNIISLYEAIAEITEQMLAAAHSGDWEHLAALESRCASHVRSLESGEPHVPLSGALRERKVKIIHKVLAHDREIRNITEPWMARLSTMLNSAGTERKLSRIYGGVNQAG